jgi:hypothetical protein
MKGIRFGRKRVIMYQMGVLDCSIRRTPGRLYNELGSEIG